MQIVTTSAKALDNIEKFEREVEGSPGLQDRMAYVREWYAYKDDAAQWHFGPSKYIGYEDTSEYLKYADERDGRCTEAQLRQWFEKVDPDNDLYQELSTALFAFLTKYSKAPNAKWQINVLQVGRAGR